jgi:hypothetical protein
MLRALCAQPRAANHALILPSAISQRGFANFPAEQRPAAFDKDVITTRPFVAEKPRAGRRRFIFFEKRLDREFSEIGQRGAGFRGPSPTIRASEPVGDRASGNRRLITRAGLPPTMV